VIDEVYLGSFVVGVVGVQAAISKERAKVNTQRSPTGPVLPTGKTQAHHDLWYTLRCYGNRTSVEPQALEKDTPHTEVDSPYSIVHDSNGRAYLRIDTYGSKARQIPGKKSQSIRFAPEAIEQLKSLLARHL